MLGLWPLPYEISVPVYLIAMLPLAAGFIAGGMVAWIGAGKARARVRAGTRQINAQEREITALQGRLAEMEPRQIATNEGGPGTGRDIGTTEIARASCRERGRE